MADDIDDETGDPSVPPELLELHVELEDAGVSPDELREWADAADVEG